MPRWLLLISVLLLMLGYTIWRDIRYERTYTGDLRNRVTGARMIKDGRSPYFYKWRSGDGLRYYDPQNFDTWRPSNMTSTPVLYRLLSPLVEMPQATISGWWLVMEYLMLAAITIWAFRQTRTPPQKQAVLLVVGLALMTNGWKEHVSSGQTYLCIPFFAMLFLAASTPLSPPFQAASTLPSPQFLAASTRGPLLRALAAGIAATCLVGIRPNTVLFFLPFLFLARYWSRRWLFCFCIPPLLFGIRTLSSSHERGLWRDYFNNVTEATKINQQLHPDIVHNTPDPHYRVWEGVDSVEYTRWLNDLPSPIYSENANFFVPYNRLFHRSLPVAAMGWLAAALIVAIAGIFIIRRQRLRPRRPSREDIINGAILGSCLFMIADLFSPIYRHQYYTVQWFLPLMLAASVFDPRKTTLYTLLLMGLLLNCIHLPFIKMGNTIGEYGILFALTALALGFSPHSPKGIERDQEGLKIAPDA